MPWTMFSACFDRKCEQSIALFPPCEVNMKMLIVTHFMSVCSHALMVQNTVVYMFHPATFGSTRGHLSTVKPV